MKSSKGRAVWAALLGGAAGMSLAACDGGPASAPARDHAQRGGDTRVATAPYAGASNSGVRATSYGDDRADPRREPVPLVKGKPMWAANRLHTAQENAEYHFEHDGPDFGASSVDDFVTKVHAFVDKPPQDAAYITRANGDRLIYDAQGNVFAVVTKDGAPRTMFKPRAGAAYWDEQKAREAAQADRGDSADTNGGRRYYSRKGSGSSSDDQG